MKKSTTTQLVLSALFLALGVLLPLVTTHALNLGGSVILPMHIPILLCGFFCGWKYALVAGFLTPLLSGALTGMPPIYPVAIWMAFELATYGAAAGLLTKKYNVFISLIGSMLAGRLVLGIVQATLMGIAGNTLTLQAFLTSAFITALPGIILQLIMVPTIVLSVQKYLYAKKVA